MNGMVMPILKFFLRDSTLKYGGCCTESICQDNPDVAAHAKSGSGSPRDSEYFVPKVVP